jgi:predicted nucleic acid-binding Zn ribbon protein
MKSCKNCQALIKNHTNIFCSQSCSASFNNKKRLPRTKESREKTSKSILSWCILKGRRIHPKEPKSIRYKFKEEIENKVCLICSSEFQARRKTCSKICQHLLAGRNSGLAKKGKPGPSRERSGRGKNGHYDGQFFNSTWELAFWIYCKDHGKEIRRSREKFLYQNPETHTHHNFYPDFRVDGKLVEIKGY